MERQHHCWQHRHQDLNVHSDDLNYQISEHNQPQQFPDVDALLVVREHDEVRQQLAVPKQVVHRADTTHREEQLKDQRFETPTHLLSILPAKMIEDGKFAELVSICKYRIQCYKL